MSDPILVNLGYHACDFIDVVFKDILDVILLQKCSSNMVQMMNIVLCDEKSKSRGIIVIVVYLFGL